MTLTVCPKSCPNPEPHTPHAWIESRTASWRCPGLPRPTERHCVDPALAGLVLNSRGAWAMPGRVD